MFRFIYAIECIINQRMTKRLSFILATHGHMVFCFNNLTLTILDWLQVSEALGAASLRSWDITVRIQ